MARPEQSLQAQSQTKLLSTLRAMLLNEFASHSPIEIKLSASALQLTLLQGVPADTQFQTL